MIATPVGAMAPTLGLAHGHAGEDVKVAANEVQKGGGTVEAEGQDSMIDGSDLPRPQARGTMSQEDVSNASTAQELRPVNNLKITVAGRDQASSSRQGQQASVNIASTKNLGSTHNPGDDPHQRIKSAETYAKLPYDGSYNQNSRTLPRLGVTGLDPGSEKEAAVTFHTVDAGGEDESPCVIANISI